MTSRDHRLDPAEQLLVLELLVAEADQRLQRGLVAEPVVTADLENLGVDEAFHEPEQERVGSTLHLREQARFGLGEKGEVIDLGKAVRQEALRQVELPSTNDVGVDVPANPLRSADATRIARGIGQVARRACLGPSLLLRSCASLQLPKCGVLVGAQDGEINAEGTGKKVLTSYPTVRIGREICPDICAEGVLLQRAR